MAHREDFIKLIKKKKRNFISCLCLVILLSLSIQAYGFQFKDVTGKNHALSDYKGKWVLVNFWATWCSSCITEMPEYEAVYQHYTPDFVVLGVNFQEVAPHVQQYADGLGLSFPVVTEPIPISSAK